MAFGQHAPSRKSIVSNGVLNCALSAVFRMPYVFAQVTKSTMASDAIMNDRPGMTTAKMVSKKVTLV